MNEWIQINRDAHCVYTEVMFLGCIGLIRTYRWCAIEDVPKDISIIEIDYQSAKILADKFGKQEQANEL